MSARGRPAPAAAGRSAMAAYGGLALQSGAAGTSEHHADALLFSHKAQHVIWLFSGNEPPATWIVPQAASQFRSSDALAPCAPTPTCTATKPSQGRDRLGSWWRDARPWSPLKAARLDAHRVLRRFWGHRHRQITCSGGRRATERAADLPVQSKSSPCRVAWSRQHVACHSCGSPAAAYGATVESQSSRTLLRVAGRSPAHPPSPLQVGWQSSRVGRQSSRRSHESMTRHSLVSECHKPAQRRV
jgi:hypothetical protein